jgi:hypothetical protein
VSGTDVAVAVSAVGVPVKVPVVVAVAVGGTGVSGTEVAGWVSAVVVLVKVPVVVAVADVGVASTPAVTLEEAILVAAGWLWAIGDFGTMRTTPAARRMTKSVTNLPKIFSFTTLLQTNLRKVLHEASRRRKCN